MYADAGGILPPRITECSHLVTTNGYLEVIKTHMHSVLKPVNCLGKCTWALYGEFCLRTTHWKRCCLTIILKTRKVGLERGGIASRTHLVSWQLPVNLNTSIWKFRASIYIGDEQLAVVWIWATSLKMMIFRSIHSPANSMSSFFVLE